jgi:predicted RNA methylase
MRRAPGFILNMSQLDAIRKKLEDPGFTAGKRDVAPLFELLAAAADEDEAAKVVRALSVVPRAAERAEAEWAKAAPPMRHRLVMVLARARGDAASSVLVVALADVDPRTRKAAARGLGRMQNANNRESAAKSLRERLAVEDRPEVKRAIVEALGKIGGEEDARAISSEDSDAQTERVRREAVRRIERTESRAEASRIAAEREIDHDVDVELRCREGLEAILAGEIGGTVLSAGRVSTKTRSLRKLTLARTWSSAALVLHRGKNADAAKVIADRAPLLRSLTEGAVRWRVEWIGEGHRRAATRELAEKVHAEGFVNDPVASDWEIEVGAQGIFAIPKSWDDARFAYRVADVPAASHPTIAAALARVAGPREDDVVWDPFTGSGVELVERARLGPYKSLLGTDTDDRALAAAKKNTDAARVRDVKLERADARTHRPRNVTLVITNPPMGRRIQDGKLDEFLTSALENISRAIVPGGRLVWITPRPKTTNAVLERAGLKRDRDFIVDMKGFVAHVQHWTR